ncbi:hypothetical protein ACIOVF_19805 [Pseudomonas sp. NPDC087612]|uniref:hypothetical protein n=1 Tax=unclassified Pseudomonas TaxID=196821 RepID=UPI0005EBAC13|nr:MULTISPECIES: hypothetical protein [unclassified Pseudomonas]KJK14982.1 hypothetical protein UB48_22930 [Pseudomonas sp. 2(2015)]QVM94800.1 hypothetical protein JYG36_16915 [Pseudomonas sp. SORT22]UVM57983.1 hypothetical protein LOY37_10530 [Pseudomonas sp. B21-012]SDQ79872.1 hypothetical protein SAMN05216487_3953 [Pseudomonas sp. UC 17F4]
MDHNTSNWKGTAVALGFIGCITLIGYIINYTSTINVFLIWDFKAYSYIAICFSLVALALLGTFLLNHHNIDTNVFGGLLVLAIAGISQMIFGVEPSVIMCLAGLYVAGVIGLMNGMANKREVEEDEDADEAL